MIKGHLILLLNSVDLGELGLVEERVDRYSLLFPGVNMKACLFIYHHTHTVHVPHTAEWRHPGRNWWGFKDKYPKTMLYCVAPCGDATF